MYNNLAEVYDKLMYDVDYTKWADYIEGIFKANKVNPKLILDLGCGTGSFTIEMSKRGYEMIGLDLSVEMLSRAKQKTIDQVQDILYLNQDMTSFELYGTVDVVVCLMDGLNHITSKTGVNKLLKLVKNYLNPKGLFIFDINSCYKFENILGNNVFYDIGEENTFIWLNHYNSRKMLCDIDISFFSKEGELFRKFDENLVERAYLKEDLFKMIGQSGLDLLQTYDELKFRKDKSTSERIFFVCKK